MYQHYCDEKLYICPTTPNAEKEEGSSGKQKKFQTKFREDSSLGPFSVVLVG